MPMPYTVEQIEYEKEDFGCYKYRILKNGAAVAEFWHNYRGEPELFFDYEGNFKEDPPFGSCSEFLTGGGPMPLDLSKNAIKYLEDKLG